MAFSMLLPWVSRRAYDDMRESRDRERESCANLRADLADLRRQYHELRRSGAETPLPVAPRVEKKDPVAQAIILMSRGSAVLRKQLFEFANEQRAAGTDDDAIAAMIIDGVPDDDGVPEGFQP